MPIYTEHKLTTFQRYAQGLAILAKYSNHARIGNGNDGPFIVLQVVPTVPVMEDMELLTYLGWSLRQTLTPYADAEMRSHLELYFYFQESNKFWRE